VSSPIGDPRWRRLPEERPRQILDAALEVFGERGLAGARLDDIARRAGVSKGTIYLYFPNKEELFREVVRTVIVGRIEAAAPDLRLSPTEQLEHWMREHWAFVRSREFQAIYRLVTGELHNFPDLAAFYGREVIGPASDLIAGIIRRGIEAGEFRPMDPRLAARTLSALIVTHATWCERRALFQIFVDATDEQVFSQVHDFFFHAIRSTSADPSPARTRDAGAAGDSTTRS
jgi:AcrR family transcriptional regulator